MSKEKSIKVEVPQEVLEGLNAVREVGTFNMFDVEGVIAQAAALDYQEAAEWIEDNRNTYLRGIFQGFRPSND